MLNKVRWGLREWSDYFCEEVRKTSQSRGGIWAGPLEKEPGFFWSKWWENFQKTLRRTEGNSWGSMARGPYPSCFVTRMPGSPFTVFFFVVPWIHHHESLQLLFAWRQVLLMRNPSSLLPGIPGCGCLHPLLSSSQKHHHKFCICVIYWADFFRTRPEDIWAVPL